MIGEAMLWQVVASRIRGWGDDFIGECGLSPVGAVVGATYPQQAQLARELMPNALILVPGCGAQSATAADAVAAARPDGSGIVVNASRSVMYAYLKSPGTSPAEAARKAAEEMRGDINRALASKPK
jgi:orotidine-5'-phosphate decarboxylase